ncbi:MAG: MMPL family transporter, partial [Gammaproteobacteria bacterium]|nr:MMPL family transporter [Gammaproteobacteria bacterium]
DIADGAQRVVLFFALAFLITVLLVLFYTQSVPLALAPLFCSLLAVVWQLGLLSLLGYGMDPMSILVPFLVFAIGVSHGVQMVSAVRFELIGGADSLLAAKWGFRRLLLPGSVALLSDSFGFLVITFIDIEIIQEMAIAAGIGVAVIVVSNLFLLPLILSYVRLDSDFQQRVQQRREKMQPLWNKLAFFATKKAAYPTLLLALLLFLCGGWQANQVAVGDLHRGVPELSKTSPYNLDAELIAERFSIGMDLLTVIVEAPQEGCVDYAVMTAIDQFVWQMENVAGVQSVLSLSSVAKRINAGWNEGSLKWRVLPRETALLAQAVAPIESSSGLLNRDCSVMPVYIFSEDHKAVTINRIIEAVKKYRELNSTAQLRFRLASGNVGVMAATNEEVESAQLPILLYIFAVIALLCLLSFRSWRATLAIILPLALVSTLAYALMALLQIGLKVNTLPVVALGVGIGVDYGIYIYSRLQRVLEQGLDLHRAYAVTLEQTGSGVLFTGVTLAVGVLTWLLSPLQFQADMGLLLAFMFLLNMLAALVLLPALAFFLQEKKTVGGVNC